MKKFVGMIIMAPAFLITLTTSAFSGAQGCGGNCTDCHTLEKKEASEIIKKVVPDGRIMEIKLAPAKGLWEIEVETGQKRGALYLDFSKKYLIAGQIIPVESIGKPAPERKVDFSKIPLKDALVMGRRHAKKKIVVFDDPDCPFCKKLHEEIKHILSKRGDVAFYIILNPLPMHKDAYKKALSIQCAKSSKLLDDAFMGKALPDSDCSNEQLEKNIALAKALGINGAPTLVREDGTVLPGYLPADKLMEWIDAK